MNGEEVLLTKRVEELEGMVMQLSSGLNMLRVKYGLSEPSIAAIDNELERMHNYISNQIGA